MILFVIFLCVFVAKSSSEHSTISNFVRESSLENFYNTIDINSSNRTYEDSKEIFSKKPSIFFKTYQKLTNLNYLTRDK